MFITIYTSEFSFSVKLIEDRVLLRLHKKAQVDILAADNNMGQHEICPHSCV